MNRRSFTFGAFFDGIGAAIGKALGYDGRSQDIPTIIVGFDPAGKDCDRMFYAIKIGRHFYVNGGGEPLKMLPEDTQHWSEAQIFDKLEPFDTHDTALDQDIFQIIKSFKDSNSPHAIKLIEERRRLGKPPQAPWCAGHNGPALLSAMHATSDGRMLCAYCLKQEQDDGRDPVTS
jgi:hypothetical protein